MKRLCMIGLVAMLAAPAAFAGGMPAGAVTGYLTQSGVDIDVPGFKGDDDGMGFGIRGWASVSGPWFVHGEYQTTTLDDSDQDLQSLRLGGGFAGELSKGSYWIVKGEYVDFGSDFEESGFGVHGGALFSASDSFGFFGTLGYLSLEDTDGLEFDVGGKFSFTKEWGLSVDYRSYLGSVDPDGDFTVDDLRVGATYTFY